jgi:hypothetical protein
MALANLASGGRARYAWPMRKIVIGACVAVSLMMAAPAMTQQAQQTATAIELGKELQECSLYYALWAGNLITQVPKNSLSPADRDKAVQSMVYMTKSEQIEVIVKRLAKLTGMTDAEFKDRRNAMFEQIKRWAGVWNMGKLDGRYKAFCESVLSDAGGKARLQDLAQGNVCGGLYKCW